jgi:anti-sigma factor RsiW
MPLETLPSCQDFRKRMDLFLDGEVDGRTMRELALHIARCPSCEDELRQAEQLQDAFAVAVRAEAERVDVASLWRSIESALDAPPPSLLSRLRERWQTRSGREETHVLALAASAAVALLVVGAVWSSAVRPVPPRLASNKADIDSLSSSSRSVAVWTEPVQQTTAIWVNYER